MPNPRGMDGFSDDQLAFLRPYAFDLRKPLLTEGGVTLDAWTTVSPARRPSENGAWERTERGTYQIAIHSGTHLGRMFEVTFAAMDGALNR